jgi:hypothetical protein
MRKLKLKSNPVTLLRTAAGGALSDGRMDQMEWQMKLTASGSLLCVCDLWTHTAESGRTTEGPTRTYQEVYIYTLEEVQASTELPPKPKDQDQCSRLFYAIPAEMIAELERMAHT